MLDPDAHPPGRAAAGRRRGSRGWPAGTTWYFVGRRAEQRRWPAELTGPGAAGIVICGIGGTGKTTLAAELTARIRDREPGRILVSLTGPLTLEGLLGAVTSAIRRELLVRGQDGGAIRALDVAARPDLGWADRLARPARARAGPGAGAGGAGQLRRQPAPRRRRRVGGRR